MKQIMLFITIIAPMIIMSQGTSEFMSLLLGNVSITTYVVGAIFMLLGIIVSWYFKSLDAVKHNPNTPDTFQWKLFLLTKIPRKVWSIIVNSIIGFAIMRFSTEMFGMALTMFFCFSAGLVFDRIVVIISKIDLSKIMNKIISK